MPKIVETYMTPDELRESDTPEQSSQPASGSAAHHSSSHHAHRSVSHHAGSHRSSSGGSVKHKSRKSKKSSRSFTNRVPLWSRISAPLLQCRRCGERYRTSWSEDKRCPKCGRYPMKIQPWESALYTLFFPAAIIGSMVHYGRSPRNAAIIFGMGLAGLLVEVAIYIFAR